MAIYRHLAHAPIVEAILDFRVTVPSSFDVTGFLSLKNALPDYPIIDDRWAHQSELRISKQHIESSINKSDFLGYFFKSSDGKNVAQFRKDGFTFSRLNPYTNWETVLLETKRLWKLYFDLVQPKLITRLATRYINRIKLAIPLELEDYLTAPPHIPEGLPQNVTGFFSRTSIIDRDLQIEANIVQTSEHVINSVNAAIILDIDVYKITESGFAESAFNDNQIWPIFQQLCKMKNEIFFQSITEKTAGLFEK